MTTGKFHADAPLTIKTQNCSSLRNTKRIRARVQSCRLRITARGFSPRGSGYVSSRVYLLRAGAKARTKQHPSARLKSCPDTRVYRLRNEMGLRPARSEHLQLASFCAVF